MNVPNLPTDNLYKFMALSGVVLVIAINFICIQQFNILNSGYDKFSFELAQYKVDKEILDSKFTLLKKEMEEIEKSLSRYDYDSSITNQKANIFDHIESLKSPTHRAYVEFLFSNIDYLFPEFKQTLAIEKKNQELQEVDWEIQRKKALLIETADRIEKKENQLTRLRWVTFFLTVIAANISIVGFRLWYKKVQIFIDKKIKDEANTLID